MVEEEIDMISANDSANRAELMVDDPNSPIDLTGLDPEDRAHVMIHRHDCPINLEGLSPSDRAYVMVNQIMSISSLTIVWLVVGSILQDPFAVS